MSHPEPGSLVNVPENAYMYGVGPITLRVRRVLPTDDPEWLQLVGQRVLWDGTRAPDEVTVTAKVSAIRPARDSR